MWGRRERGGCTAWRLTGRWIAGTRCGWRPFRQFRPFRRFSDVSRVTTGPRSKRSHRPESVVKSGGLALGRGDAGLEEASRRGRGRARGERASLGAPRGGMTRSETKRNESLGAARKYPCRAAGANGAAKALPGTDTAERRRPSAGGGGHAGARRLLDPRRTRKAASGCTRSTKVEQRLNACGRGPGTGSSPALGCEWGRGRRRRGRRRAGG